MKFLLLSLIFSSTSAFAEGSGHAGDLIPAAFNVLLLVGLIIYFTKDTLKAHFAKKSADTKEVIERAASKAKEAAMMMEMQQKKMNSLDSEIQSMEGDVDSELSLFEADYKNSLATRVANLKTDAGQKIEAERKGLLDDLNSTLLDQVIAKSKAMIKAEPTLSSDAAKNMIQGLK